MGVNQKFCKVTVHRASPPPKPTNRPRRQTIGHDHEASTATVDSENELMMSTRGRANTTTSAGVEVIKGRVLNPLGRMTLRMHDHQENPESLQGKDQDDEDVPIVENFNDSRVKRAFNNSSFLDVDTDGSDPVRQTLEDAIKFFAAGTPPIPAGMTIDMLPNEFNTPPVPSHFRSGGLYQSAPKFDPMTPIMTTDTDDEDEEDDSSSMSSFIDIDSDEEVDIDVCLLQTKEDALKKFEASLDDPHRVPYFRTTEIPTKNRQLRGLSSPPRMLSQVIRRNMSIPVPPHSNGAGGAHSPANSLNDSRIRPSALYHGQTLHLSFKTSTGLLVQASGQPKRRSKNIFSKRIRCNPIHMGDDLDSADALRIISHTSDGSLHGGDRISLARSDGHVLRIQTMSKKLCFSPKIDLKAKFVITGVPEGTVVTSTTKFYLQSVYDRSKTVGFLKSRRSSSPGCLVMYAYRNKDDKSEPIQFFKHDETRNYFQPSHQQPGAQPYERIGQFY